MDFRVLLISYLVLLSIVECWSLKNLKTEDQNSKIVCEKLPHGQVQPGWGIEIDYHPYVHSINQDDLTKNYNYTVYKNHVNENCSSSFESANIQHVYQMSANKVMICLKSIHGTRKILSFDMNTCEVKDIGQNIEKLIGNWSFYHMINYADGFDLIVSTESNGTEMKNRISYDMDGNRIDQPRPYQLEYKYLTRSLRAISPTLRSSNIIASYRKGDDYFVSVVDDDGERVENLLQWKYEDWKIRIDVVNDSVYAYCKDDDSKNNRMKCVQFDQFGNELYRNFTNNVENLLVLQNLKGGGIVLFTHSDTEVRVVEMRPGKVIEKSYPFKYEELTELNEIDIKEAKRQYTIHDVDINEADGQFTIRTIKENPPSVCWYTLPLPSSSQ